MMPTLYDLDATYRRGEKDGEVKATTRILAMLCGLDPQRQIQTAKYKVNKILIELETNQGRAIL